MKTCKRGHPRIEENIIRNKKGYVHDCRPCTRLRVNNTYRNYTKEQKAEANRKSRENYFLNREKRLQQCRDNVLKRKYGITREEYNNMFIKQNFQCANEGCKADLKAVKSHLDHSHTTGTIRGILCNKCNLALGMFDDNVDKIRGILNYVLQTNYSKEDNQFRNKLIKSLT